MQTTERRHVGRSGPASCDGVLCAGPTVEQIEQGVKWALQQRQERPVFFHCAHGHGRSNVLMCATLLKLGKAGSVEEADLVVQQVRPEAGLNRRQREALQEWVNATLKSQ